MNWRPFLTPFPMICALHSATSLVLLRSSSRTLVLLWLLKPESTCSSSKMLSATWSCWSMRC